MRKLIFAKKINGTDETGLIDIAKNPPELFCLCEEDKANEILNFKAPVKEMLVAFLEFYRGDNLNSEDIATIDAYIKRKATNLS